MVLPLAALGISAASQLYQSVSGGQASQANSAQFPDPGSQAAAGTQGDSGVKLNIPTKLSSDISALLLSLQAGSDGGGSGAAGGTASGGAASGAAAAAGGTGAAGSGSSVQDNLQAVLGDLQGAGGSGRHHHHGGHHGGPGPNDASTTTTATTTTTTADANGGGGTGGVLGQLSRALSAYAAQGTAGAASTGLLTA